MLIKIITFSQAISWVRWFSFVETSILKTISVLILMVVELMWVRWTTQSFYLYLQSSILRAACLSLLTYRSGHCPLYLVQPSGWEAYSLLDTRLGSDWSHCLWILVPKKNIHMLRMVKDNLGPKILGMYQIPCECGTNRKIHWGQVQGAYEAHMPWPTREVSGGRAQCEHRAPNRH
jgi:hypothetical protein